MTATSGSATITGASSTRAADDATEDDAAADEDDDKDADARGDDASVIGQGQAEDADNAGESGTESLKQQLSKNAVNR